MFGIRKIGKAGTTWGRNVKAVGTLVAIGMVPIGIISAIGSMLGRDCVLAFGTYQHGVEGALSAIISAVVIPIFFGLLGGTACFLLGKLKAVMKGKC